MVTDVEVEVAGVDVAPVAFGRINQYRGVQTSPSAAMGSVARRSGVRASWRLQRFPTLNNQLSDGCLLNAIKPNRLLDLVTRFVVAGRHKRNDNGPAFRRVGLECHEGAFDVAFERSTGSYPDIGRPLGRRDAPSIDGAPAGFEECVGIRQCCLLEVV